MKQLINYMWWALCLIYVILSLVLVAFFSILNRGDVNFAVMWIVSGFIVLFYILDRGPRT